MKVNKINYLMGLLIGLIGLTTNSLSAQIDVCNTDADFTATASGANTIDPGYALIYVLVQVDGITVEATSATGTFTTPADGTYTLYAVNHDGAATFASWPPSGTTCFETISQAVTVSVATCPPPGVSACENESATATASGANTVDPGYVLEYMLVCGGSVVSTNGSGTFDLDALGVAPGACDLYAVNHDGTGNLTVAPPTGACLEYITQALTVLDAPDLSVNLSLSNVCPATTADLTSAVVSAGGGALSYFEADGITPVVGETAVPAGTYVISSTDGTCTETATVTVSIIPCTGPSVCEHEILMVTASNANTIDPGYVLDYMLVCGGSVTSVNGTGTFDMLALGVTAGTSCTVYAVNHDGTANTAVAPPTGACLEFIDQPVIVLENTNGLCDVPLPVELLSFTGQAEGKVNVLNWTTETEENSDYFDVERSTNGQDFSYLGTVEAAGFSLEPLDYRLTDEEPEELSYYRLKMVDLDESYEYSNVVVIKRDATKSITISSIRPIPTSDQVNIEFLSQKNGEVNFWVTDVTGKLLDQTRFIVSEGVNEYVYDFSEYPSAVYIITMDDQSSREIKRVVKN